jgi:hypothetical protein
MVHARGYNDWYDIHYIDFETINAALQNCHNIQDYAYVFTRYGDQLTDFQMSYTLEQIAVHKIDRTPQFWDIILPKIKKQIPTLDR